MPLLNIETIYASYDRYRSEFGCGPEKIAGKRVFPTKLTKSHKEVFYLFMPNQDGTIQIVFFVVLCEKYRGFVR